MTLEDYKETLELHDWFYYFSDDHRVYVAGEQASKQLLAVAEWNGDDFKRAYNEAHAKRFNTPSFTSDNRPYNPPFSL